MVILLHHLWKQTKEIKKKTSLEKGMTQKMLEGHLHLMNNKRKSNYWKRVFLDWTCRGFNTFVRAYEKCVQNDIKSSVSKMEGKTEEENERYGNNFEKPWSLREVPKIGIDEINKVHNLASDSPREIPKKSYGSDRRSSFDEL